MCMWHERQAQHTIIKTCIDPSNQGHIINQSQRHHIIMPTPRSETREWILYHDARLDHCYKGLWEWILYHDTRLYHNYKGLGTITSL